jgi:hypothetical protein
MEMIGKRFGKLTVIEDSGQRSHKAILWKCFCDCGNFSLVKTARLIAGITSSCGCIRRGVHIGNKHKKQSPRKGMIDKIGLKIHRLTIIDMIFEIRKPTLCVLKCECGNTVKKPYREFIKGKVKSCGCIRREQSENAQKRRIEKNTHPKQYQYIPKNDITGQRFGMITVLYWCGVRISPSGVKAPLWLCGCNCGKEIIRTESVIKSNKSSCGCMFRTERRARVLLLNKKRQEERIRLLSEKGYIEDAINHKRRRSEKTVRYKAFLKHGANCIICKKEDNKKDPLCIHHLKAHWLFPLLRSLTINNVPLCRECHDELHKRLGYGDIPVTSQLDFFNKHRGELGLNHQ